MQPHRELKYTYREYALLPDDGKRHELIEGDFYVTPAPSTLHQRVLANFFVALRRLQDAGHGEVFVAPVDVILEDKTAVQPDLLFLRNDRRALVSQRGIEGPPNVVIEILSPNNRGQDE